MDWLAPVAILLSAVLAWQYHRRISAKRATVDFIASTEVANEFLAKARVRFAELSSNGEKGLLELATRKARKSWRPPHLSLRT